MNLNLCAEVGEFALSALIVYHALALVLKKPLIRQHHYLELTLASLPVIALLISLLKNDFSLQYVADNSHVTLPFFYKIGALWAGHEGSWLLWLFVLCVWKFFYHFSLSNPLPSVALIHRFLSAMILLFLLLLKYLGNPFALQLEWIPQNGVDLNPTLQDPALMLHPPFLFLGYAGLAIPWAWSLAVLWQAGSKSGSDIPLQTLIRWVYPWVLLSFSFLTIGIALGSWWAYYELGWGGFWFWDPVENASLMPWLVSLALIHAVKYALKRPSRWNEQAVLFLSHVAFTLSLLGTFLVRSGLMSSVHAFAQNRIQAKWFLILVLFCGGFNLLLHVSRLDFNRRPLNTDASFVPKLHFKTFSLLLQSTAFGLFAGVVFLGTMLPFFSEIWGFQLFSIAGDYYNQALFFMLGPVILLMPWILNQQFWQQLLYFLLSGGLVLILAWIFKLKLNGHTFLNFALSWWLILSQGISIVRSRRITPMRLAHLGAGFLILGIMAQNDFGQAWDFSLQENVKLKLNGGSEVLQLNTVHLKQGPNFGAHVVDLDWEHLGRSHRLRPEKRAYWARDMTTTEVAIEPGFFYDLYFAWGEPLNLQGGRLGWSAHAEVKPFVRHIWIGALIMATAGFYAAWRCSKK